tara:strand:+ start:966 stop:2294 length:1329 start_codon:yes stop_codon:yes gene_type:complete
MIKFLKISTANFILIFLPSIGHALTPSSYLIANQALSAFDYSTASKYYNYFNESNLNVTELRKKIIALVNSNQLQKADLAARAILKIDNNIEEAWMVILCLAKLNHNNDIFNEFLKLKDINDYEITKYVFFENNSIIRDNNIIADKIFDIFDNSKSLNYDFSLNIDYYLFYLNLALKLNPNFSEVLYFKGQIFQELKYYSLAENNFLKIKENNDLYIDAQKNIFFIKKKESKFNEAEDLIINLIEKFPNNSSLRILLADLYKSNKEYNKAINHFTILVDSLNINIDLLWRIYYMRGICYERLNNWKKAENDFLEALRINPNQPQVLNYLAYGWIEKNYNLDKSIEMLKTAVKENPNSHYILDSLGWGYYKKNNFIKALKFMEKVIDIAPQEAISLDHLGDIYFSLGRKREAYFMWVQALDLSVPEDNISENVKNKINAYNEK